MYECERARGNRKRKKKERKKKERKNTGNNNKYIKPKYQIRNHFQTPLFQNIDFSFVEPTKIFIYICIYIYIYHHQVARIYQALWPSCLGL